MMNNIKLILLLISFSCTPCENYNVSTGIATKLYPNGQLMYEINVVECSANGKATFYYDNGSLKSVGHYSNARKVGYWKYYDSNGVYKGIKYYENGTIKNYYYDSLSFYDAINNVLIINNNTVSLDSIITNHENLYWSNQEIFFERKEKYIFMYTQKHFVVFDESLKTLFSLADNITIYNYILSANFSVINPEYELQNDSLIITLHLPSNLDSLFIYSIK